MPEVVITPTTSTLARPKNLKTLEVRHIEVLKLSNFNQVAHTFQAQFFSTWAFLGGALPDEADGLNADGDEFPIVDGKPTFRPPAGWFIKQFEINNVLAGQPPRLLDTAVRREGDDLLLNLRWEGTFYESFELYDFPFDSQGLTVSISLNCRTTGPIPVEIKVPPNCGNSIDYNGYTEDHNWHIVHDPNDKSLRFLTKEVGGGPQRMFPTFCFSVLVQRRSSYTVVNAVIPFTCFSILALSQFCVRARSEAALNHRAQMTTMLVLTGSAYKMAVGGKLPAISYLTLLDKYMLLAMAFIVAITLQSRGLSLVYNEYGTEVAQRTDIFCLVVFVVLWLVLHLWLIVGWSRNAYPGKLFGLHGKMRDENIAELEGEVTRKAQSAPVSPRV